MGLLFTEISEELGTFFFRVELLLFQGKSGDTLILRNLRNQCEITLLLHPEDLSISRMLSMLS
jgi:hypothetical protein